MGIFGFLAGRIGLPLVLIAGAGALIFAFRSQLIAGAQGLGSTVGSVITSPFTSFFDVVRNAFSDLGDINIDIPGINITGGGFNFDLFNTGGNNTQVNPNPFPFGQGMAQFPPGCTIDNNGIVTCPSPPGSSGGFSGQTSVFGDPERRTFFDILNEGVSNFGAGFERERSTRQQLIEQFPSALGLFDIQSTQGTERIPLSFNQLQALINQGEKVRLSFQFFEEFSSVKTIQELFA